MAATALSVARATFGYRKLPVPKPAAPPSCKNCRHLVYDASLRPNLRGELLLTKAKPRCPLLNIKVQLGYVCTRHAFKYANCADA